MLKFFKKAVVFATLVGFLLPAFSFGQTMSVEIPKSADDAQSLGEKIIAAFWTEFPKAIRDAWTDQIWPLWQNMFGWVKQNIWEKYISPLFDWLWQKMGKMFGQAVEERRPGIEEDFEAEKQELKEEIPKTSKSLWQKIKELF